MNTKTLAGTSGREKANNFFNKSNLNTFSKEFLRKNKLKNDTNKQLNIKE